MALLTPAAGSPQAPPAQKVIDQAEDLHRRALDEAKRKRWQSAIELWDTALSLRPIWKYAFNQALVYEYQSEWLSAWRRARQAQRLGTPNDHASEVDTVLQRAEKQLLVGHALIRLRVVPADAAVTLDHIDWQPPRERWVQRDASIVLVKSDGYEARQVEWAHPIGVKADKVVTLAKAPAAEAAAPAAAEPAPAPLPPVIQAPKPSEPSFTGAGWTAAAGGLVALGGGAGMFAWAGSAVDDAEALNADPPADQTAYDERRQQIESSRGSAVAGGWILTGVGAASLVTGVVLLLIDGGGPNTEATSIMPLVLPGGAGVRVGF